MLKQFNQNNEIITHSQLVAILKAILFSTIVLSIVNVCMWVSMVVQQVALLAYSSRVLESILTSGLSLSIISHVLAVSAGGSSGFSSFLPSLKNKPAS